MNHLGTITIETDRLILRQYKMTDADDMFSNWVADPEISRFWGWELHKNIEETKSLLSGWIAEYSRIDNYHWVIVLKETSQAIGYIYLNEINDEKGSSSVHYLVSRKYWNQGIMTEACKAIIDFSFSKIGMLYIHTHHHVDNHASGKVMQKSGFRYIETKFRQLHDCEQISGDYCYYEISKDDWLRI
jgi:ribosomal-protein-alanine N-acetyltransferase